MKRNNRSRDRIVISPIKIYLSEAEIMADLRYPAAIERPVTLTPQEKGRAHVEP